MRFLKSIRWQLQLWHGLLLLGVIAAFGVTAFQLEKTERNHAIDADLQGHLSLLVNALRAAPRDEPRRLPRGSGAPAEAPAFDEGQFSRLATAPELLGAFGPDKGFYYVVWMRDAKPAAQSSNAPPNVPRPVAGDPTTRFRLNHLRETFIFAAPVDCVLVGRSVAEVNAAILFHAALLAAAGGVLLALGLAGGSWLTARALRPVREISITAHRIAGGDLSQRINASRTENELTALANLLNSTFARLEAAFTQQARFTSDAAHELRTPLTVLLTQTQAALARERGAAEYRETLLVNESTARRMKRLVESLLELARLDAGQEPLRRAPCDLAAIASDCAELMRPLAEARGIELKLDLAEARCEADPERIAQVITNLVQNAIDYNVDRGEARIVTRRQDGCAMLEISDTGAGIPAEHLPHLFDRFYRVHEARPDSASHSGLGLAISKAIVDAHGGRIDAVSDLGRGTTFRIVLPVGSK